MQCMQCLSYSEQDTMLCGQDVMEGRPSASFKDHASFSFWLDYFCWRTSFVVDYSIPFNSRFLLLRRGRAGLGLGSSFSCRLDLRWDWSPREVHGTHDRSQGSTCDHQRDVGRSFSFGVTGSGRVLAKRYFVDVQRDLSDKIVCQQSDELPVLARATYDSASYERHG